MDWDKIRTEERNAATADIDSLPTPEMLKRINREDKKVADAVEAELAHIAAAVDVIAEQLRRGGRLIYLGCGTSGRLGVLDAVECVPTYSSEPGQVVGVIAGGEGAMFVAAEGAEDDAEQGAEDLRALALCEKDVLVGITASGRTPYVLGAMDYARNRGARVIALTCCPGSPVDQAADIAISPTPGPEVIAGSTRMKCGTAEKMVLNMLSTGAMIRLGKVYGNLMVDVKPTNEKLRHRCRSIVSAAAGVTPEQADALLLQCGYRPKPAIVMALLGVSADEADLLLSARGGRIAACLKEEEKHGSSAL